MKNNWKPILLWATTALLAVAGILLLPTLGGFAALAAAILLFPVQRWQEILEKVFDGKIKTAMVIVLALLTLTGIPSKLDSSLPADPSGSTAGTTEGTAASTGETEATGNATTGTTEATGDPTTGATEGTGKPTEAPAKPTEAPAKPTEAPAKPTEAPAKPTEAPTQPTTPANTGILTQNPAAGSRVVLYLPAQSLAVTGSGYTYTSSKGNTKEELTMASATASGSTLSFSKDAAVLTVQITDGKYAFVSGDGKYLYADGTNVQFVDAAGENTLFVLEPATNGFYIRCANATYNDKPQYLEVYKDYLTCYGLNESSADIYIFQFYTTSDPATEVGSLPSGGNSSGDNTSGGNTSGGNTSGDNTSGGNTSGDNTSGSQIVKEEPSSYDYVVNTSRKKIHHPTCQSVADMKANSSKNLGFFSGTLEELEAMGYSPCGNCHAQPQS